MRLTGTSGLFFAIRPLVLVRYLCLMLGLFGILTSVPFAISLAWGNSVTSWSYFCMIALSLLLGMYGFHATRGDKGHIQRNESLALVALVFIVVSLMQSIPIMSYGISF